MKFEIASKFEVGDSIVTKDAREVHIVQIRMRKVDKIVNIEYLIEYKDGTRLWEDEDNFL